MLGNGLITELEGRRNLENVVVVMHPALITSRENVDEAVEIPLEYYNTDEAYRRYQFDVQFSGSDYADDPAWEAKREYLRKKGSDVVFFPYTQSTSSTKIKELIDKRLM